MAIKNVTINNDYTIDVYSSIKDEYKFILYKSDFNSITAASVPAGWGNNVTANPTQGPVVVENSGDSSDRIFALKGSLTAAASVDDPPSGASYWRWVKYNTGFSNPIRISFRIYAGDVDDDYSLDAPEAEDQFYFQYKLGSGGSWVTKDTYTNTGEAGGNGQGPFTGKFTSKSYDIASNGEDIYVRWISARPNSTSTLDHWAIDDVKVVTFMLPPVRLTFLGPPNLRLQQSTSQRANYAFRTFLGKQKV